MGITFIGMGSRSSGKVRGIQVSEMSEEFNFYDTNTRQFYGKFNKFMKNIIFVRNFNQSLAQNLKSAGYNVGFDMIDRPVAELHRIQKDNKEAESIDWSCLCNDFIDFYIVTNTFSKNKIKEVTGKKVYVIPHHTVSESLIAKDVSKKPKVLGYLGIDDQLSQRELILEFCKKNNLEFYENHPKDRYQCREDLKKIDIGVVYLDLNKRTDYVLKVKPNQKLSNYQCFGIPSVVVGYESYKEFGGESAYILAENTDKLIKGLEKLLSSESERKQIQENGYKAAEKLLLKNLISYYNAII